VTAVAAAIAAVAGCSLVSMVIAHPGGGGLKSFACHTVSWRIRIFNCIEEVPRFFFSIEFNPTFQISNYLQFNCTPYTI
jgi:hypothetical protein